MKRPTSPGRFLATIAGCAFAAGGLTILLDKELLKPFGWAASQWLTILMVFGVIAAGHLMASAGFKHFGSGLGFFLLFVAGTGLVVYSSVGRQVEAAGVTTLTVEDVNGRIADKADDLRSARERKAFAEAQIQKTMIGSTCGKGCRDWKQNAKDVGMAINQLEAEIAALGPQKPVNAQAAAMADILLLFHIPATKAQIEAALAILVPFLKTLFFEIGAIVSFGFAFRPSKASIAMAAEEALSEIKAEALLHVGLSSLVEMFTGDHPDPVPPNGGRKTSRKSLPANVVPFTGKHPALAAIEANGGSVASNRELATLMAVSDGEASKRWKEISHLLDVRRDGREVRLALK